MYVNTQNKIQSIISATAAAIVRYREKETLNCCFADYTHENYENIDLNGTLCVCCSII